MGHLRCRRPLLAAAAVAAALAAAGPGAKGFQCLSDVDLGRVRDARKKGIALDDSTLRWCASQVPEIWPNTGDGMSSIRLFKAWDHMWSQDEREAAWDRLLSFVDTTDARVLIGAPIACDEAQDNEAWEWTKQLLQRLGPKHVMGLAIGNELELLQFKGADMVPASCIKRIWEEGYLWTQFQRITAEFDALDAGFRDVPVTSVFTGMAFSGSPFYDTPQARVNTFMKQATQKYGKRFAFTWNFYPYFDPNLRLDKGSSDQCAEALQAAACWGEDCIVPAQTRMARQKQKELTGRDDDILWIGETGWSSQQSDTLTTFLKPCPAWSSQETFHRFYTEFLDWDLSIGAGVRPPDHVFWFTMRDAINFGKNEFFGLISQCDSPKCKVSTAGYEPAGYSSHMPAGRQHCGDDALYNGWSRGEENCRNKCTLNVDCNFYAVWPHSHDGQHWCLLTETCDSNVTVADLDVTTYKLVSADPRREDLLSSARPLLSRCRAVLALGWLLPLLRRGS